MAAKLIEMIGTFSAGAAVGFLGYGAAEALERGLFDSSDYLLFAFIMAILSSICYNIVGKSK